MALMTMWIAALLLLSPATQATQGPPPQQAPLQETACEALVKGVATAKDPGIIHPVITRKVEAKYSIAAYKAQSRGVVILCAVIDTRGRVDRSAVKRTDDPLLDAPALDALKQWRFRPAQLNGAPVPIAVELEFVFALR
jgi:protein TonB